MLSIYPACFFKERKGYSVVFPDLNYLATSGKSEREAMSMAVDCLAGYLYILEKDGEKMQDVALGDGPIDAAYNAIDAIIQPSPHSFDIFNIHSISEGKDTLGDVTVKVNAYDRTFTGRGLSTDIMEASINAYLKALNRMAAYEHKHSDKAAPIKATQA